MKLAVYQPDIAANLGAIIRIGACFGAAIHVIEPCGFPFSAKPLRRSAMDYFDIAKIVHHDSWDDFAAANKGGRMILLSTKGRCELWGFAFRPDDFLLLGQESAGVPSEVADSCAETVKIPMPGPGRSLNVAVSAGIALSEAMRQTR